MAEEIKHYPLIPFSEISEEARAISVAWHENATNWIGDKHKLGSDIMNYAQKYSNERVKELEEGLRNLRHGLFKDEQAVNNYIDQLLTE